MVRRRASVVGIGLAMALVLALVPALVMVPGARAQTNIDRGKPPSELFANYCAVCHKTTRGLATGRNSLTLSLFLREHYATSREQAAALAAYVISAGGNAPAPTKPERAKTEEPKNQEPKTQESKGHEGKPRPTSTAARPEPEKSGADRQPGREEAVPAEEATAPVAATPGPNHAPSSTEPAKPEFAPTKSAGASTESSPDENASVPRDNIPD
ncbi:MAG TPA: hypothetical protein VGV62_04375 [Xanthobacteraceae bacterium]|nr:hypothetical protein [Xanthobacteraceae bacterium]